MKKLITVLIACFMLTIDFFTISNAVIRYRYAAEEKREYEEMLEEYEESETSEDDTEGTSEDASEDEDVNQIIEDTGETEMDEVSEATEDTQETVLAETEEVSVPEEITAYYNFLSDILAQAYEVTDIYAALPYEGGDVAYYCRYAIADFDSDGVIDLMLYVENWDEEGFRVRVSGGNNIRCYTYNYDSKEVEMTNGFCIITYSLDSDCVFYGNGTVYKNEQYFNTDENFYNDIGLMPATNSYGKYFEGASGLLSVSEEGDSYTFELAEGFGVDEVKTVSYDEYQTIMNKLISDDVLDVTIYDFNAANIETLK
jgi:hypothetical protein